MITTSMIGGYGTDAIHARGMMPAAMQAIADDARGALDGNCSKRRLRRILRNIADLAETELRVEEEIEGVGWNIWSSENPQSK